MTENAQAEALRGLADGSYMRCPFCGCKSRATHKPDCIIELAAVALELQSHGPNETRWQPIVTAPKDGNIILSDGIKVSEGGWMTDVEQGAEYEGQAGMAGWWSLDSIDKPTHWMPLPSIPATRESS